MFEGEMYAAEFDQFYSVGETILIRGELDHYFASMGDRFGLGIYYNLAFPFYSFIYEEVTMHEFGIVLMGRFPAGESFQIKPGLYVGYRAYSGSDGLGGTPGTGLGVNASLAFQYQVSEKVKPFVDLGILTQPSGGNDATDITFGPVFQLSFGLTL